MKFGNLIVSALLIGLFIVALMSFSINLGVENEANTTILQNPSISKAFGNISNSLNDSTASAEAQRRALEQESSNPVLTAIGFAFRSVLSAVNVFTSMVVGMFNMVFTLFTETLNISPIITGTLLAILLVVVVLSAWRVYRAGE